jgi:4-methyl-5(b-hydroxyethyl)-thiazole monophosphate biosynthesis
LASLGILDGKNATCYPGCEDKMGKANILSRATVTDGRIITGTSAGCALPFGLALMEALKGEAEMQRIYDQIVIR